MRKVSLLVDQRVGFSGPTKVSELFLDRDTFTRNCHIQSGEPYQHAVQAQRHDSDIPLLLLGRSSRAAHYTPSVFSHTLLAAAVIDAELYIDQWSPIFWSQTAYKDVLSTLSNRPSLPKKRSKIHLRRRKHTKARCPRHPLPSPVLQPAFFTTPPPPQQTLKTSVLTFSPQKRSYSVGTLPTSTSWDNGDVLLSLLLNQPHPARLLPLRHPHFPFLFLHNGLLTICREYGHRLS